MAVSNILRKCKHCELEATSHEELRYFVIAKSCKYDKKNVCKKCHVLKGKEYEKKHPHTIKDRKLKSKYGIGIEEYNLMFLKQDGKCKICNIHNSEIHYGLCIDHCHDSGKVRGLLCGKCNKALGLLNDDISTIKNCIKYLKDVK